MPTHKYIHKINLLKLLSEGYTQKEAAIEVGVTEKTAGLWAKEYKSKLITDSKIEALEKRIEILELKITQLTNK